MKSEYPKDFLWNLRKRDEEVNSWERSESGFDKQSHFTPEPEIALDLDAFLMKVGMAIHKASGAKIKEMLNHK